jgi:hypothetical protein
MIIILWALSGLVLGIMTAFGQHRARGNEPRVTFITTASLITLVGLVALAQGNNGVVVVIATMLGYSWPADIFFKMRK